MRKSKLTALALSIGLMAVGSTDARAQSCGDTLLVDTTLTAPLTCTGPGLILGADGITLDCAGFSLTGSGTDTGILLDGRTGVTITGCTVSDFAVGILLTASSSNYLAFNGALGNTSVGNGGFQLSGGSNGNVLEFSRSSDNAGRGYVITGSTGNLLLNNTALTNGFRGFDVIDSSGNTLLLNRSTDNTSGGYVVSGASSGNLFYRNLARNNSAEGFALFSGINNLILNRSILNATFGFLDTTGPTNLYSSNSCAGNGTAPSSPAGLC